MSEIDSPSVSVAKGASYIYVQKIVINIIGIFYFAYATRILSVTEFGVISSLYLISLMFQTIGTFAVPFAATKYISEFLGNGRKKMMRGVIKKSVYFGFLSSSFFSIICLSISSLLSIVILKNLEYKFVIEFLAIEVFTLIFNLFFERIFFGLGKFKEVSIINIIRGSVKFGSAIYFLYLGFGVLGIVFGWIVGGIAGVILFSILLLPYVRGDSKPFPVLHLIKYSLPLYASNILSYILNHVDRFFILFYGTFAILGVYSIANQISLAIIFLSQAIETSLFPYFSSIYGKNGEVGLRKASMIASRYISIVFIPLALGLAIVSYPTITLLAGSRYIDGTVPLFLISLGYALASQNIIATSILLSTGETRVLMKSNLIAFFTNFIFCLLLVPNFGIIGASLSKMISILMLFSYNVYWLSKKNGFYYDKDTWKNSLLSSIVMSSIVFSIENILIKNFYLPLYVLIGGIVYCLMLRLLKIVNASDLSLLKKFFPKPYSYILKLLSKFFNI